jgi:hypothetical protein
VHEYARGGKVRQRASTDMRLAGQLPRHPVQPGQPVAELDDGIVEAYGRTRDLHRPQR